MLRGIYRRLVLFSPGGFCDNLRSEILCQFTRLEVKPASQLKGGFIHEANNAVNVPHLTHLLEFVFGS